MFDDQPNCPVTSTQAAMRVEAMTFSTLSFVEGLLDDGAEVGQDE